MINLKDIKFSRKIAALSVIPICGLLLLAAFSIEKQIHDIKASASVILLADFSVHASVLVHELQKERGMSSLYLSSKGKEFRLEVMQQRGLTDSKIKEYQRFLDTSPLMENLGLKTELNQVEQQLEKLESVRQGIIDLSITPKNAIDYYTALNEQFLQIIAKLPKLSSNVEMAAKLAAYSNFLKAKEKAGIERAVLSSTFANDGFLPGMYEKLIALIAAQDAYQNVFFSFAPPDYQKMLANKTADAVFAETEALRKKSLEDGGKGPFGVDPQHWFKVQTAKINLLKEIEDYIAKDGIESAYRIKAATQRQLLFNSLFITVIIGLSATLFWILRKDIAGQIGGEPAFVEELTAKIAAGQLDGRGIPQDERHSGIYGAMMRMQRHLSEVIGTIMRSSEHIAQASREVNSAAQTLSQSNCEMAASIEQTSATLDLLTDSVDQNRENAQATEQIAKDAANSAISGSRAVKDTIEAMKHIAAKISLIEDIAYQTNLLSLNASIEAARAGVHGAGFQVVAAEVRKLATRSETTANEIRELTANNVEISNRAGDLLDSMLPSIEKTALLIQEIALACREQATGVKQINEAISQMNTVIQQNAAASEQLAATAEELSEQSQELNREVGFFKFV